MSLRSMRTVLCLVVAASLSSAALLPAGLAVEPAAAGWARTWQPEFMAGSHSYTQAEATNQARSFDVIIGAWFTYRGLTAGMRSANPDLVLLGYNNGGYSTRDNGSNFPNSWYAHDSSGRKIKSVAFGNYLMNPASTGWRGFVAQRCVDALKANPGFDGCFLDSMGPAALQSGYATGVPVNPATGKRWTQKAWVSAQAQVARAVKSKAGGNLVVANGVINGREYFNPDGPTADLAAALDGAMVELFVRRASAPAGEFRSVADWKKDVDMLVAAGKNGQELFCVTKAWVNATDAQKHALHRYAFATFLLGTNGKSYFSFLYDKTTSRESTYWNAKLGVPTGAYTSSGGVYRRGFTNGLVLVNPGTTAVTVPLPRTFQLMGGGSVSGSLRLAPHTAAVLTYA